MTREEYVERMEKEDDWAPGGMRLTGNLTACIPDRSLPTTPQISRQEPFSEAIITLTAIRFMSRRKGISI